MAVLAFFKNISGKNWKTLIWGQNDVIMTSSCRHNSVYVIVVNYVIVLYLTSNFHDNHVNTFGYPPPPLPPAQELQKSPGGIGLKTDFGYFCIYLNIIE